MIKTRVIPVLLWGDRGLIKPIGFQKPGRFVGSLMPAIMLFETRGCDELILLDTTDKAPRLQDIQQFTSKLFCPLAVGGGIRTLDDIRELLKAGADKAVLSGNAGHRFIRDAAHKFGSQSIAVHVTYTMENRGILPLVCQYFAEAGAGEIILTSIERDGTRTGYDLDTIGRVARLSTIPVVACGGCSGPDDMVAAIKAGAHAVAASSIFLYDNVTPMSCAQHLDAAGIPARIAA